MVRGISPAHPGRNRAVHRIYGTLSAQRPSGPHRQAHLADRHHAAAGVWRAAVLVHPERYWAPCAEGAFPPAGAGPAVHISGVFHCGRGADVGPDSGDFSPQGGGGRGRSGHVRRDVRIFHPASRLP